MKKLLLSIALSSLMLVACQEPNQESRNDAEKIKQSEKSSSEVIHHKVNFKINSGKMTPGMEVTPNTRINLKNGQLEVGMPIGNMWIGL